MSLDPREQEAWDAYTAAGKCHVPTVDDLPEITTERAVFEALAVHLRRIHGRVEYKADASRADAKAFDAVLTNVPTADQGPKYPTAFIDAVASTDLDTLIDLPVTEIEDGETVDVVTDTHALWRRGEDVGDGTVKIFALSEPEAVALATAVREAMSGSLNTRSSALLPMPVRSYPPPFRDQLTPRCWPSARITPSDSRGAPVPDPESGVWSVDVDFSWSATRYVARPRIADFRPFTTVET